MRKSGLVRSFDLGRLGDFGFVPRGCGGVLKNRRIPRSIRRAISHSFGYH
jgi:hypothetical protein